MSKIKDVVLAELIEDLVMAPFYKKRIDKLEKLSLEYVLSRKNPYLFRAKNIISAGDYAKAILDAFLISQEETIFGNLLEELAIAINSLIYDGKKAEQKKFGSVDLLFDKDKIKYAVGIKSGPHWGNNDQLNRMKDNFKKAHQILRKEGWKGKIININGCMYGKEASAFKKNKDPQKSYYKYCGQEFWNCIADDSELYQRVIIPLEKEAQSRDAAFKEIMTKAENRLTEAMLKNFCRKGLLDWQLILDFVSKK
jgi:hypothetical protein